MLGLPDLALGWMCVVGARFSVTFEPAAGMS